MKQARRAATPAKPASKRRADPGLKTPAQARLEFERKGLSIRAWALANRLPPSLVYDILRDEGHRKCLRGKSHRAAVLLGIKDGELVEPGLVKQAA